MTSGITQQLRIRDHVVPIAKIDHVRNSSISVSRETDSSDVVRPAQLEHIGRAVLGLLWIVQVAQIPGIAPNVADSFGSPYAADLGKKIGCLLLRLDYVKLHQDVPMGLFGFPARIFVLVMQRWLSTMRIPKGVKLVEGLPESVHG